MWDGPSGGRCLPVCGNGRHEKVGVEPVAEMQDMATGVETGVLAEDRRMDGFCGRDDQPEPFPGGKEGARRAEGVNRH